jgi:hypothetical protein
MIFERYKNSRVETLRKTNLGITILLIDGAPFAVENTLAKKLLEYNNGLKTFKERTEEIRER